MKHEKMILPLVLFCLLVLSSLAAVETKSIVQQNTVVIPLDGSGWQIMSDAANTGLTEKWFEKPAENARQVKVPSIIQDAFPGYHGVAWYWRNFTPPANPHEGGRYLLRFCQVDYLADVWINGIHLGQHEGGEDPFVLDATDAIKPGTLNHLAVRVLNPTREPIDGISLEETPRRNKSYPPTPGCDYNYGGITDSVELLLVPPVRIEDLFVRPDPKTGRIRILANIRNAAKSSMKVRLSFLVSPANAGGASDFIAFDREIKPGDTPVDAELTVKNPQLWELNDPYLYRVTTSASATASPSIDQQSTRCGFRDFRFEDGTFQLNGRRLFLKCSHTGCELPCMRVPVDPDMLRKDLLNCKVMGFNAIRFISGMPARYQLDVCDEIGLMVYEECFAGWCLKDSPNMAARFDHSTTSMIRRDRNHASITMWGLLNETKDGPVFRHALQCLPLVHSLDDTRLVFLSSGRWDNAAGIGSLANPGVKEWQNVLEDKHPYQPTPHTASVIEKMRNMGKGGLPFFWSEHGTGSAVDLARLARHFEQWGKTNSEDAVYYRDKLDRFTADWRLWNLGDTFANPEDYFRQCLAWMASMRKSDINAIRANPNSAGYSLTGTQDQGFSGEGLTTLFRELKPGTFDAMFDAWYPLRWCLFVEPVQVYRGQKVHLEAVLSNEDTMMPGDYPVRFQVVGPGNIPVFDQTITATIPDPKSKPAPKFTLPVLTTDVQINGPTGRYRFLASFQKGGAATGGDIEFYAADPAGMPAVKSEIVTWGDDQDLSKWITDHGIKSRPFVSNADHKTREVILVGKPKTPCNAGDFCELAKHIARGSRAVFLSFDVFKKDAQNLTHWLPLSQKGNRVTLPTWLYHKDDWAKNHPIFDGLPSGRILDHIFYREIISKTGFSGQEAPAEVVAGAIDTSCGYHSALTVAVCNLGAGKFVLNALNIRDNLGKDPVAERLFRNMLNYAAQEIDKPLADLPADFDKQLTAMGYK